MTVSFASFSILFFTLCLTRMRSSQDMAITVLDRYEMYAGDKSDAGVG